MRSHSHRVPHGPIPLLGRFLEEDVENIGEPPIIPKPYKPIFSKKSSNEVKNWVPNPLESNQIFRKYSILDSELRKEMNFNSYLDIMGLKRSSPHGTNSQVNS